ncbi:hypothetical protein JD844_022872 [Phrynosoma platyrhinos]|uniref:Dynein axonemal heavy chain 11 n=1 Tax=Phrynosoma platyrhinos TaxID=52577 RepID=A0ABQ7SVY4_PHRPL|nr:hypothetical protein JD844_022872 [Phrynosoma platyrhinos]
MEGKIPGLPEFYRTCSYDCLTEIEEEWASLQSPKVHKILEILHRTRSSYYPAFNLLIIKVEAAVSEAQDICLYLSSLKHYIAYLEESSFSNTKRLIAPLFHTICLIWTHSKYYCFPNRIVVLLQEFCNLLIDREIFTSAIDFLKLEKIEIGGLKGKILSEEIHCMNEEFHESWKVLQESKYNPLDYENQEFLSDYTRYIKQINVFDNRLGTILNLAFQEPKGLESAFKILQIFGKLLERAVIYSHFYPNVAVLLSVFDEEITCCKQIFDNQIEKLRNGGNALHKNMPMTAGNLKWSQELRERLLKHRTHFRHINHLIPQAEETNFVFQKCEKMLALLDKHDKEIYTLWVQDLSLLCESHLSQPILRYDNNGLFEVNFNEKLSAVLREVKYLEVLRHPAIPEVAVQLYSKRETLYKYLGNLNIITRQYNQLRRTILPEEAELIAHETGKIDLQLKPAFDVLTWQNENLWSFIEQARELVQSVGSRLQKAKDNVELIQILLHRLNKTSFLARKTGASPSILCLDYNERICQQYEIVQETGRRIHQLVQDNQDLFQADPLSDEWRAYTEYIDHMVSDGLFKAIKCSLQYLLENTEMTSKSVPLFELQLLLNGNVMTFMPPLDHMVNGNFSDVVEGLIQNIYLIASHINRVAKHLGYETYQHDVDQMDTLKEMHQEIMSRVRLVIVNAQEYQSYFKKYSHLWMDDKAKFMKQFLLYGRFLHTEELELYPDHELQKRSPQLEHFKQQISIYETLHKEVSEFENQNTFNGWFRVDIKPFKFSLMNMIKKWSWMFKEHLLNSVTQSVRELATFIHETEQGLAKKVKEGDYALLVEIMGHLMAIRDRQSTGDIFKPLKSTAELLRSYGQQLPEHIYVALEELPEKWKNLKKIAFTVKHEVAPLQSNEVSVIRRKCVLFEVKQQEFRNRFKNEVIFRFDAEDPYTSMDKTHKDIAKLEAEMNKLQETANLFEVSVPEYRQLKQCRTDIILAKSVWDMVVFVQMSIKDWMKTPWKQINVEQMDVDLRRFMKDMKTLDKEVRIWDVYIGLESTVKNLLTSLRAVNELQNLAVRKRHWQQLMAATGVSFVMNEDTTLGELFALQLHRVEDEVKNIVDKAVKEMAIEKLLVEINQAWSVMDFSYEEHHSTGTPLLKSDENLIEILEDNQELMAVVVKTKNVIEVTNRMGLLEKLEILQQRLTLCEKSLAEYLDAKRLTFPRFYFVSSVDLLEIISKGTHPRQAECWLSSLEEIMHMTVKQKIMEAVVAYEDKPRDQWLFDYPAQVALTSSQIWWATDVRIAFERLEEGFETALKDYNRKQASIAQLNALINMLLGELTPGDRQKIMTICTIDVHARDVVAKLIAQKVSNGQAFTWLSQLRHQWDEEQSECFVNICDAQFQCYITLTQSLHLTMSGALSGPAGTGKTETTKDLGRSLGMMVYVFNCSEQMDYKSIGNIYKGLCQTGVWGCFDEFNRISVEVLSVVAVQVKMIQDAIRHKKKRFNFLGETIKLKATVGIFITLNPGYAGRAELPENLKALFRPCAMVIPDLELICEIMLVAEGFVDARLLSRKFICLYKLCHELLSKQVTEDQSECDGYVLISILLSSKD